MAKKKTDPILCAPNLGVSTNEVSSEIREQFPAESEGLGAWGLGRGVVGLAHGVNDESARLAPGFTVTRYELKVLAHHYLDETLRIQIWWEWSNQVGSDETRQEVFARRRFETIAEMITCEGFEAEVKAKMERCTRELREIKALPECMTCGVKHTPRCSDGGGPHKRPYMACPPPPEEE